VTALRLLEVAHSDRTIAAACAIGDARHHFSVTYEDLDLAELADAHGKELVARLAFHVAMFQLNAMCSQRPETIELGPYARFATSRFQDVWRTVFRQVWGQWRYEQNLPDYLGPAFVDSPAPAARPAHVAPDTIELLAFCGGGKDSLVALKLLERAKLPFATLGYAHSIYGDAAHQHALLDRVAVTTARARAERQWIVDDLPDDTLRAETPASVFAALPLALARGYGGLVVAHESSANAPNLVWHGEPINHQWGKGWDAEQLLDTYVREELLANVRYFSILQPVHDEVIFELLARDADLAPRTHSCNLKKPWCGACAKCAYVWLQMAAHLPRAVVDATFSDNLGERPENTRWFRELFGLAEHTPFECTGSAPEARLALALLPRPLGPQLARFAAEIGTVDVQALAGPLVELGSRHGMPEHVAAGVMPQLADAAAAAKKRLGL
jgi:hypothetical protein